MLSAETKTCQWSWQGFTIRYQQAGERGVPLVCIHGFGASSDHWRKNLPALGQTNRVYAIDLLGFGFSAKPQPNQPLAYTFETWSQQVRDFCREVVGEPVFIAANSIGCVVAMQAAVDAPEQVRGIVMLNCSLRMLHERNRQQIPWHQRMSAPLLQSLLGWPPFGQLFFAAIARPKVVRNLLQQAYGHPEAVTDELVEALIGPAREPGAAAVFLAFVRYSQGPLPRDLLPQLTCPVLIAWGSVDPWEPLAQGRPLADYPAVEDFVVLEGVGHCPMDEAPDQVNPLIRDWVSRHAPNG